jgi:hypothetical protein
MIVEYCTKPYTALLEQVSPTLAGKVEHPGGDHPGRQGRASPA